MANTRGKSLSEQGRNRWLTSPRWRARALSGLNLSPSQSSRARLVNCAPRSAVAAGAGGGSAVAAIGCRSVRVVGTGVGVRDDLVVRVAAAVLHLKSHLLVLVVGPKTYNF
jgi:hypothetical protein